MSWFLLLDDNYSMKRLLCTDFYESKNGMIKNLLLYTLFVVMQLLSSCGGKSVDKILHSDISDADTINNFDVPPQPEQPDMISVPNNTEGMLQWMRESDNNLEYSEGILMDMARDVPEYAYKLLNSNAEGFLIVDKATMKIYRYDKYGRVVENFGMACSKNYGSKHKRRDNRTPEGFFEIEGKYDSTEWLYTDDDGNTSEVKGQFGPRFLRLKTSVTSQIGIHGTCAPWSIGGRRSHGCIRVKNENILHLDSIVQKGWPVIVSPGKRDMAVNIEEGYSIPSVAVVPGQRPVTPGKWKSIDNMNASIEDNNQRDTDISHTDSISTSNIEMKDSI